MKKWQIIGVFGCLSLITIIACSTIIVSALFVFRGSLTPTIISLTNPQSQNVQVANDAEGDTSPTDGSVINRLLVQGADGNIYITAPDGTEQTALTEDADNEHFYQQPTWSSSGEKVAWVEIDTSQDAPLSILRTSARDGSALYEVSTRFPPFYLYWSPDDNQLAYLSNENNQPGMALSIVDMTSSSSQADILAEGQPFYFSWSPDSERFLAHISNDTLALQSLDGQQKQLPGASAQFGAPQWSRDGQALLYALETEQESRLVLANEDGVVNQEITAFEDGISFGQTGKGDKIAYILTPADVGLPNFGPLYIHHLDSQETSTVTEDDVVAFFWSPNSQYLAYLTPETRPRATPVPEISYQAQSRELWMRWHIWDGQQTYPLSAYIPTTTFIRSYLPFFDQYARSLQLWSPDSQTIVYAGRGRIWARWGVDAGHSAKFTPNLDYARRFCYLVSSLIGIDGLVEMA